MRKEKNDRFNTSVPCFIKQVRKSLELFSTHPGLPKPWPKYVPCLEYLHRQIECLELAHQAVEAMTESDTPTLVAMSIARRELKTSLSGVVRYVELTLRSVYDVGHRPRSGQRRKASRPGAK